MSFKLALNISTAFGEDVPFIERYNLAKNLGFQYVEAQDVYDYTFQELKQHKPADLVQVLINSPAANNSGLASSPGMEMQFCKSISDAAKYSVELGGKMIHILAGITPKNFTDEELEQTYIRNLSSVQDIFEENEIIGLIEPICPSFKEDYYLSSFEKAIAIIEKIGSPFIRLLLDVFHLHKITGDVEKYLPKYYPYAGHVQVSQDPGRSEPFSSGNINYGFVFDFLKEQKYSKYIGLEYSPSGSLEDSLKDLKEYM